MSENTVRQLASFASAFVQTWTHELRAMNDNEEPDPPPAMAARIPRKPPFTSVERHRPLPAMSRTSKAAAGSRAGTGACLAR